MRLWFSNSVLLNSHTDTHRHTDTDRHTDTHRHTDTNTQTHTDTDTHRHTNTHRLSFLAFWMVTLCNLSKLGMSNLGHFDHSKRPPP